MKLIPFFIILLLVATASGGPVYSSSHTISGTDVVVIQNVDQFWASGSNLDKVNNQVYTDGAAGSITLTGPGKVNFQAISKLDATNADVYTSTGYLKADNGIVSSESLSMSDYAPNQTDISCTASNVGVAKSGVIVGNVANSQKADGQKTFIGQSATVTSAKFINDAEYEFSGEANWTGPGGYTEEFLASSKIGASKNSSTPNYQNEVSSHYGTYTTNGTAKVHSDDTWGDFTSAFVTNAEQNTTLNITNTTEQ